MDVSHEFTPDPPIRCKEYRIGAIGAGFIMADVHLAAYREAGFAVAAIASRTKENAARVAKRWDIPTVWSRPEELIEDPRVEILDIAFPPDQQPELIRRALRQTHIKGILAQKPMTLSYASAKALVEEASAAGKIMSVNQNMRFDQSMRVLKQILDRGLLGQPVFASIDMRATPSWQPFLAAYDRLTILNMSVHHLDILRFLFGEPEDIYTAVRTDPRTSFPHTDGICTSTLRFHTGVLATTTEDVWTGPNEAGFENDSYIRWRVEGTEGLAQGSIGWPEYPPGRPSTLSYSSRLEGGKWQHPTWNTMWFPHALIGVMEQLQFAVKTHTRPELDAADNVSTMAVVEAAYLSIAERRAVPLAEFGV